METPKTYQIRVPEALLNDFREAAKIRNRSPAAELRDFMKWYVRESGAISDSRPIDTRQYFSPF